MRTMDICNVLVTLCDGLRWFDFFFMPAMYVSVYIFPNGIPQCVFVRVLFIK